MDKSLTQDEVQAVIKQIAAFIEASTPTMYYATSEGLPVGQVYKVDGSVKYAMPDCYFMHHDDFESLKEKVAGQVNLVHIREWEASPEALKAAARLMIGECLNTETGIE